MARCASLLEFVGDGAFRALPRWMVVECVSDVDPQSTHPRSRAWTTRFWRTVGCRRLLDALTGVLSASCMRARMNAFGRADATMESGIGGAVVEGAAVASHVDLDLGGLPSGAVHHLSERWLW